MDEARKIAEKFGLTLENDLSCFPLIENKIPIIPYLFAKQKKLLPLEESSSEVLVAISDPLDIDSVEELRLLLKKKIRTVYADISLISAAIESCYQQKEGKTEEILTDLKKEKEGDFSETKEGYDLLEVQDQNPVVQMVNSIIIEAIQQKASDIHFEPAEEGLFIRYRIDGCLQKRHSPPKETQIQVLTRLKVMAKMDIAEHRLPQDGRIKLRHGGREVDFRVSTLPTVYGERIVLRILDKGNTLLQLDRIGMSASFIQAFRKLIHMPEGIVLVTGPTGSGKTTTLYSAIHELNSQETNIMTIEDPVEYKFAGISQMNVNPKIELDFARGLRHILRQDPDIIMIGEIRDRETAEIAIQSSLTGHLVLSTLHTNDAPSALTRLADMGIEPYLLASSVLGVLAQRLVRQICPHCKTQYAATPKELEDLKIQAGAVLYRGEGCIHCYQSGYKGRRAIYELMNVGPKIKNLVLKSLGAQELRVRALEEGMKSIFDEGVDLVLGGITTSTELLRVTRMDQGDL